MVVDTIAPPPSAAVGPFTCLLELLATFFTPSAQASAELAAAIPRRRPRLRLGSKGYRPVARHLSLKRTRATRPQRAQPTPPGGAARLPASDRGRQHRVTFLPGLTYTPGQGRARGGVARIVTWLPGKHVDLGNRACCSETPAGNGRLRPWPGQIFGSGIWTLGELDPRSGLSPAPWLPCSPVKTVRWPVPDRAQAALGPAPDVAGYGRTAVRLAMPRV